jgi:hypothetical protein
MLEVIVLSIHLYSVRFKFDSQLTVVPPSVFRLCLVASACPIAFISSNLLKIGDVEFLPLPAKKVCCLEAANQGAPLFVSKGT